MTSAAYEQYRGYQLLIGTISEIETLIKKLPSQVGCSQYDYGRHVVMPIKTELLKTVDKSYEAIIKAQENL